MVGVKYPQQAQLLGKFIKSTVQDLLTCNKLDIYMHLPFRLLQEDLTPCYAKMSDATVK